MPSERAVRTALRVQLAVVAVTALFSVTYFHPDEHFQVLEPLGVKLGTTTDAQLTWEFGARMRAWMQPAAYFVIAKAARAVGVRDTFALALLLRFASGLLSWLALSAVVRTTLAWAADAHVRRIQLRATTWLGFLPYLAVRTSSENVSGALFALGFCSVLAALPPSVAGSDRPVLPARVAVVAGTLFGLAFECRFQTGVLVAGFVAWLLAFRRLGARGALGLAGGVAGAVGLGLVVDRWGYGAWCFPAWEYLRINLVDRVASARFGTDPFYGYLYLLPANIFAPVVLVFMLALVLTWARRPKHPVTWTTLPYVLVASALAHKEERLLFPMILVATPALTLGLSPSVRATPIPAALRGLARWGDAVAARVWRLRASPLAWLFVADDLVGMLLLAVYPLGWDADVAYYDFAYHHVEPGARVWTREGWGFPDYPFYKREPWQPEVPATGADVDRALERGEPSYFVTPFPFEAVNAKGAAAKARLVYSEFPGWTSPAVRDAVGPALERFVRAVDAIPHGPRPKWLTAYRLEAP
jgi:phosphatidylinositol glycan class B